MKCPSCEEIVESDWLFCPNCGAAPVVDSDPAFPETSASGEALEELRVAILSDIAAYREHKGTDEDIDALIRGADPNRCDMWRQAARLGWPEAQWLVSRCYWLGWVFSQDPCESGRFCDLAAQQGEPLALYGLAARCEAGYGVEPDPVHAAVLYRRAAGAGLARAQCRLAEYYLLSGCGDWEMGEAVKWLRSAANQGLLAAEGRLAELYIAEGSRAMPCAEGAAWLLRAAKRGDPDAQRRLARCYAEGEGVAADRAQALHWYSTAAETYRERPTAPCAVAECYRAMAELGDAEAQYLLGECYASGEGIQQDPHEAVRWYEQAVERGHAQARLKLPEAFLRLGEYMSHAEGGTDFQETICCYRKAAAMDSSKACLRLAECYASGKGVTNDMAEAVTWFRKAAESGEPVAQFRLGLCYASGDGVARDDQEAIRWYQSASDAGLAPAQFKLGMFYSTGGRQQKDLALAVQHFTRAAEQGYVRAQAKLGECYAAGEGVAKNWDAAVKWLCKASKAGDDHATQLLRRYGVRR